MIKRPPLRIIVGAWIDLFDALIRILTFGYVYPAFGFRFVAWCCVRDVKKRQKSFVKKQRRKG